MNILKVCICLRRKEREKKSWPPPLLANWRPDIQDTKAIRNFNTFEWWTCQTKGLSNTHTKYTLYMQGTVIIYWTLNVCGLPYNARSTPPGEPYIVNGIWQSNVLTSISCKHWWWLCFSSLIIGIKGGWLSMLVMNSNFKKYFSDTKIRRKESLVYIYNE